MSIPVSPDFREARNHLQNVACEQTYFNDVPIALARALVRTALTTDKKKLALGTIREWVDYSNDNSVPSDDPFAIRYHVPKFAELLEIGEQPTPEPMREVDIASIVGSGSTPADILSEKTSRDILSDPEVAVVGGAARLVLKLHAGMDISSELPINDIDAVIASGANDIAGIAEHYGIDLSGAKIVDGDVRERLSDLIRNFDCTMNQVAVHGGKLLFTDAALRDIKSGDIRLIAKNDPLFGSEGETLPDGNAYLNRKGFYRGLGFLLRDKGSRLVVSQENIEREKDAIGRYWQVLLYVKLLPMVDESARYDAVGHWHDIAKRMGSTEAENPQEFLKQLMLEYPETAAGNSGAYDSVAQARWIIGKMIVRGLERLHAKETFVAPPSYTDANLSLSPSFPDYDYPEFIRYADNIRKS